MSAKKEIKESEARIILYLSIVHPTRKYVTAISNALEIDYSYLMKILPQMVAKGWLKKHQVRRMVYYDLTGVVSLESAKNSLYADDMTSLQNKLEQYTEELKPVLSPDVVQPEEEAEYRTRSF